MSDFFEPLPPPSPRPRRYRQPPWLSSPPWTLPGVVPLEMLLVHADQLAIGITRVGAYPIGFTFELFVFVAPEGDESELLEQLMFGPRRAGPGMSPGGLRIGVQFADGSKATDVGRFHGGKEPPEGPVLHSGGSSGGGGRWRMDAWVWPLPPPGPLAFVCEWPAASIPLTRHETEAQPILDAAQRAKVIFSDEGLPEPPR